MPSRDRALLRRGLRSNRGERAERGLGQGISARSIQCRDRASRAHLCEAWAAAVIEAQAPIRGAEAYMASCRGHPSAPLPGPLGRPTAPPLAGSIDGSGMRGDGLLLRLIHIGCARSFRKASGRDLFAAARQRSRPCGSMNRGVAASHGQRRGKVSAGSRHPQAKAPAAPTPSKTARASSRVHRRGSRQFGTLRQRTAQSNRSRSWSSQASHAWTPPCPFAPASMSGEIGARDGCSAMGTLGGRGGPRTPHPRLANPKSASSPTRQHAARWKRRGWHHLEL